MSTSQSLIELLESSPFMNPAEYPVYDFITASKVDRGLSLALKNWLRKFNELFQERWFEFSPSAINVTTMLINAMSFEAARSRWSRPSIALPITIRGPISQGSERGVEVQGLLTTGHTDVIILMMDVLSEDLQEKPKDRPLTSIELNMSQLLLQTAISLLSESWLDKETLPVVGGEFDFQPNNSRLFSPQKEVIVTGFEVRTSSSSAAGPARFEWVLAKDELMSLLGVKPISKSVADNTRLTAEHIEQLELSVDVVLGTTALTMGDLLKLEAGAIVRLDQHATQPLSLKFNDHRKMTGWPGISHGKRCVMVEEILP